MALFNRIGSFAMLLATRRASSMVSTFAVSASAFQYGSAHCFLLRRENVAERAPYPVKD